MLNSAAKRRLHEALSREPGIAGAFLFGSALGDYFTASSDVDVAVLPGDRPPAVDVLELRSRLSGAAEREVDLVIITDDLSLTLRNEIAVSGEELFCRDRRRVDTFLVTTPQMFLDFMLTRKELEEAYGFRKRNEHKEHHHR